MLARDLRLRQSRDIARAMKRGRTGYAAQLHLKANFSGLPQTRVAIVVSKKVAKKAVVRNRIRRRLSGILAEQWQTVLPGYDIVILVHEDISELAADKLTAQLAGALNKGGVTKPHN